MKISRSILTLVLMSVFVSLTAFQCGKYTRSQCINSKINTFKSDSCNEGASVKHYNFQQQDVYVFDQGLCGSDLPIYVLNENCDTLGFLGGIAGNTQINGEDFSNANLIEELWGN